MTVISSIQQLRTALHLHRQPIALVPTMGALHAGHLSLIHQARAARDSVVVSIFVNPIQFNQPDDFARYPRPLDADLDLCRDAGVAFVFVPSAEEMYPQPLKTHVDVDHLGDHLCGAFRPGHFRGVATVVMKLLQIVQPDRAYFGEKDAQQLAIIRRMVADLNVPVHIVSVPTVREPDGLAMSSRNALLSAEERQAAPLLRRALTQAAHSRDLHTARQILAAEPLFRLEYLEAVDDDMQPVSHPAPGIRIVAAAWLGTTRLIDNIQV